MQKINKILNIMTIVMFVVTIVLLGLFYFILEANFQTHNIPPRYTRNNYYGGHIFYLALPLLQR